jgi:hypothetical protein
MYCPATWPTCNFIKYFRRQLQSRSRTSGFKLPMRSPQLTIHRAINSNNQRLTVGLFEEIASGSMTDGKIDRRGPVERFIPVYLRRPCRTVDDCGRRIPHQRLYTGSGSPNRTMGNGNSLPNRHWGRIRCLLIRSPHCIFLKWANRRSASI